MSDTVLSGRWVVYYKSENRQQRIVRDTSVSPSTIDSVRDLYSALQDLFDHADQMDDGIPMSAQTPTEYTIGIIDTSDKDPWFIDKVSIQYLKGGAITTSGWDRVVSSNTGIVRMAYTAGGTPPGASDVGKTITMTTDGDTGTILSIDTSNLIMYIRPATNAAGNSFDNSPTSNGAFTISSSSATGNQNGASVTGESLWANIFTIGTIATGTNIYLVQNFNKITSWWGTGHIDVLIQIREAGNLTDFGLLTIFAREFGNLYDHFTVDASSGGRNPVPLSTSNDINNNSSEGTISPLVSSVSFTFGATQENIGDGGGNQPYDVSIDVGGNELDDFYEITKYVTRRTATTPLSTSYGRNGEQYITVGELRISYESQTANFLEGATLTGQNSNATGIIVADHDSGTTGVLIVRDVRGTFEEGEIIEDDQSPTPGSATISTGGLEFTLVSKTAPFGTFAGGRFFGARGVWIENPHANDANNYQLIDSNNVTRTPPVSVPIVVSGLVAGDRVSVFRATGAGEGPNKTYLTSTASDNSAGDTTFVVQETIPADTPSDGTLRLVDKFTDATQNKEYRVRYASWDTSTFTLASQTGLTAEGTNSTTLTDSGATFLTWGIKHGDLIRNVTEGVVAYVVSVESQTELITTAVTNWTGDSYEINTLPVNFTADDTAYVPYIDAQATGSSVSVSVTYVTDRALIARVRRKGIVPFSIANTTLTSSGASISAIRNPDNIAQ